LQWLFNNNNNRFTALCPGLPGSAGTRRKNTHPPTIVIIQSLSASSIYRDRQHPACSNYVLGNLFAQPLSCPLWYIGLEPSTSYSMHFFTQSVSSFRNTCPYHCNLFCCSINIISSIPSLSHNSLLGTLSFTLHIHLTIFISGRRSATSFLQRAAMLALQALY